ncbi:hypothetical protein [Ruminococcus sp.]|uniref:hypothetical protein n=1 Tax=Ruminococcus sp. TaxID=41978 RepID=UPI0025EE1AD2|nr:hypothetical protein [Ruminococcus sp.]
MTIYERINCRIYCYDHSAKQYTEVYANALDESSIISASIKRQCCHDGAFEIGGVYAATLSMQVKLPGMSLFQVRGAKIIVWSKYSTENEWYPMGTFWVTDATRVGEIYTLNAQDAVGWLDTSSYNSTSDSAVSSVGTILTNQYGNTGMGIDQWDDENGAEYGGWLYYLTGCTNTFILSQTGIANMLAWKPYDKAKRETYGRYCNDRIYAEVGDEWTRTIYPAKFFLRTDNSNSDSDCPRDFYKYLSELAFGFISARPEDGKLELGQFGHPEFGTVQIGMNEIEYDSCDVADYTIEAMRMDARVELEDESSAWAYTRHTSPDYNSSIWARFAIESNPFLDGFAKDFVFQRGYSLQTVTRSMWKARYPDTNGYSIRPFSCTAHSTKRYHLGQKIDITYKDLHESAARTYSSIITSIQWTFRGGTQLSCGGADSRVMADCLRASKGDKVRKEARNRCRALEKRVKQLGG